MDNNLTGLQKITDRILADADRAAAEALAEARKAAESERAAVIGEANAKAAAILAKARERAAVIVENAETGADVKARGERLYVMNEYAAKAADNAKERFIAMTAEEKTKAYTVLLVSAVNTCVPAGADASLLVNEADAAIAKDVIEAARGAFEKDVRVTPSECRIADAAGFVLRFGDIDVPCVADTLFGELDGELKKSVLRVLFAD